MTDTIKLPTVFRDKCGTYAGYGAHSYRKEIPCDNCLEARRNYGNEWAKNNPEKVRQKDLRYAETHKEKLNEKKRRYRQEHPEKSREQSSRRRARQYGFGYTYFNESDVISSNTVEDALPCHICSEPIDLSAPRHIGEEGWEKGLHLDHLVPLAKGGTHTPDNIRPAHGLCNLKKHTKDYTHNISIGGPTI